MVNAEMNRLFPSQRQKNLTKTLSWKTTNL